LAELQFGSGRRIAAVTSLTSALAVLSELIEHNPDDAAAIAQAAMMETGIADLLPPAQAERHLRGAVDLMDGLQASRPESLSVRRSLAQAWWKLAVAKAALRQPLEAADAFHRSCDLFEGIVRQLATMPDARGAFADASNDLAWSLATFPLSDLRDAQRAMALANQAVAAVPTNPALWNTLGVAQYRAGQGQTALDSLGKSVAMSQGGSPADWFFVAMAHFEMGDDRAAREWYDKACDWMEAHDPQNDEFRRFQSEAAGLLQIGDSEPLPSPPELPEPR
jgi:tetratricopeptide (TPR) repeat protein